MQGILPTLIVLVVHFDLVPGTQTTETYNTTVSMKFQAGSGGDTLNSSTVRGTKKTNVSFKTETSDDSNEIALQYPSNYSNPNLRYKVNEGNV